MSQLNGTALTHTEAKKAAGDAIRAFTAASDSVQSTFDLIPGGESQKLGEIMGKAIRKLDDLVDADELKPHELIRVIQIGSSAAEAVATNQLKAARAFIEMRKLRADELKEKQQSRLRNLLIKQAELNNEEKAARLAYRYGKGKQSRKEVLDFFAAISQMRAGVSDDDLALLEQVSSTADALFVEEEKKSDEHDEASDLVGGAVPDREASIPTGPVPAEEDAGGVPPVESADPGTVHEQPVREDSCGTS